MKRPEKISSCRFKLEQQPGMKAEAYVVCHESSLDTIIKDDSLKQLSNIARLPGVVSPVLAMPDVHQGYGFPIGGVAAFFRTSGIVSPGGVGYDINCGVRLISTNLCVEQISPDLHNLTGLLGSRIPAGMGKGGRFKLRQKDLDRILSEGLKWALKKDWADHDDIERTEDRGCLNGADPSKVSKRAKERGINQVGTLGSGNHFLEIQKVERIFNPALADEFGIYKGQIVIMIHSGSRGLGHQVCDDYLKKLGRLANEKGFSLPDKELVYAHLDTNEARDYLSAMSCAANYAYVNRQVLMCLVCDVLLNMYPDFGAGLVYDVCHNIAKFESISINGKEQEVCIHRKGATRALPKGHPLLPDCYKKTGQPAILPGSMGTSSYLVVGKPGIEQKTFNSISHGAGRVLSRRQSAKKHNMNDLINELDRLGIHVHGSSKRGLLEEAPGAYKDIDLVVAAIEQEGLAARVAQFRPMIVIKG